MFGSECCVSFDLGCERRSRVFEAQGTPQLAVMPKSQLSGGPRKGKA
jgi:hypothetical protein